MSYISLYHSFYHLFTSLCHSFIEFLKNTSYLVQVTLTLPNWNKVFIFVFYFKINFSDIFHITFFIPIPLCLFLFVDFKMTPFRLSVYASFPWLSLWLQLCEDVRAWYLLSNQKKGNTYPNPPLPTTNVLTFSSYCVQFLNVFCSISHLSFQNALKTNKKMCI